MENIFPRKLTELEKNLLFSILPENKSGYNAYRKKIENLFVIGKGRFGETNLILGKEGNVPDFTIPSPPVFAIGFVYYENNKADIIINEQIDDEIEFDIFFSNALNENLREIKRWSYSEWIPGYNAPGDNSSVREVEIIKNEFLLAIAPGHKKLWLHSYKNGINLLLPVTNFYNYLMLVKNIRSAEIVFKPDRLFSELNSFKDDELIKAFTAYNKYFRHVNLNFDEPAQNTHKKKSKKLFDLFKRG